MTSPAELTYFTVTGHYYDVEAALPAGNTNLPQTQYISAYITFTPRLPPGTLLYIADLDTSTIDPNNLASANAGVALAPITARILEGELQVINRADTPNVQLVANTPALCDTTGAALATLIYDVSFNGTSYAGNLQKVTNFAFTAPTDGTTTIDLCDPALPRLPYNPTAYT